MSVVTCKWDSLLQYFCELVLNILLGIGAEEQSNIIPYVVSWILVEGNREEVLEVSSLA